MAAEGAETEVVAIRPYVPQADTWDVVIAPGALFTHTFDTVGDYEYFRVDTPSIGGQIAVTPPVLVPPPGAGGGPVSLYDSSAFLYTGPGAVQTGMAPEAIDPRRAACCAGSFSTVRWSPFPA